MTDFDAIRQALHDAIGTSDEDSGLEHWHHASGGRSLPTERDGVFVDRAQVHALIDKIVRAATSTEEPRA
jgi:hypothetical protein